MAKNNNYEISDSLWGRVTGYASSVWDSWTKDVDEYVEDVMDTDARSDEELYASTVLQDSAHSVELVAHLVGSVFSNDYTKERVKELGEAIASTDAYQSSTQSLDEIEKTLHQATEAFMQEHPRVQTAFMATEDTLETVTAYVTKEAKAFASNHPELTEDFKSIVEIAAVVPAVKVGKIAQQTHELKKMDNIDYTAPQGRELNRGIPSHVDRSTIEAKELKVTAEAEIGNEKLFDTNQQARVEAYPNTPTLRHDEIRTKEAKSIAKVERDIAKDEKEGNPWTKEEKEKEFYKATKPNATLAQSHAEVAIIQKAYEQGLTKDAHMFMKVNGKEVCGYCNSDTIAIAKEAGLKSITIHDYNAIHKKTPEDPIIHWSNELGRDRYTSFNELKEKFSDLPEIPRAIQRPGILEIERARMNKMDVAIVAASGTVLMQGDLDQERSLAQEALEQRVDPQSYQTLNLNQVQDKQSTTVPQIDTTQKSKEIIAELYPHLVPHLGMTDRQERREIQKEEPNPTQDNYSSRDINTSSDTFENNSYYIEDDFSSMPKNHRATNLPNNLPQEPLEEDTFDSTAKANEIVEKMFEDHGWNNNYDNSNDMGRDID